MSRTAESDTDVQYIPHDESSTLTGEGWEPVAWFPGLLWLTVDSCTSEHIGVVCFDCWDPVARWFPCLLLLTVDSCTSEHIGVVWLDCWDPVARWFPAYCCLQWIHAQANILELFGLIVGTR